ncbi:hypothetical protein [Pantoea sp.]|uniref:hypothetical protein n=1 Tax=Pantoea sp. TaxID=69393 RepID=UPI002897291E|nr:hypothetical protein [Pantoea sp.]
MTLPKLRLAIPALVCITFLIYWFMPHYSAEDKAYYVSVFCAIDHQDPQHFQNDMQRVIEGGNSDYALQKIHYIPALGKQVTERWQQLSAQERLKAGEDNHACQQMLKREL